MSPVPGPDPFKGGGGQVLKVKTWFKVKGVLCAILSFLQVCGLLWLPASRQGAGLPAEGLHCH